MKRRRLDEESRARNVAVEKLGKLRIRRSQVLQHPISRGFLSREQGQTRDQVTAGIFSTGLITSTEICGDGRYGLLQNPLFDLEPRRDFSGSIVEFQIGKSLSGVLCHSSVVGQPE